MNTWSKNSWKKLPILQQPSYSNQILLEQELHKIHQMPTLVPRNEIECFKEQLKEVGQGKRVILHMGDCAERFTDCTDEIITKKQQFMDLCAELIQKVAGIQVAKIGRIGGQYAKPRSQEFDEKRQIFNFKGDNVNSLDEKNRNPDPRKLYEGFVCSTATVNYLRGNYLNFIQEENEGLDLHLNLRKQMYQQIVHSSNQNLNEVEQSIIDKILNLKDDDLKEQQQQGSFQQQQAEKQQKQLIKSQSSNQDIERLLEKSTSQSSASNNEEQEQNNIQNNNNKNDLQQQQNMQKQKEHIRKGSEHNNIYEEMMKISHEGLILDLESTQTFEYKNNQQQIQYFNQSAHMIWVGLRTNQLENAHLEYMRGIQNPVGVKIGPQNSPEMLIEIVKKLNPENKAEKLIIIPRLGANKISETLPQFIKIKQQHNLNFIWMLDAMHGNTKTTSKNIKIRDQQDIIEEIRQFCQILKKEGEIVGGISLEATYDDVTECIGGSLGGEQNIITEDKLDIKYTTACDPRLNGIQTLEVIHEFIKDYQE